MKAKTIGNEVCDNALQNQSEYCKREILWGSNNLFLCSKKVGDKVLYGVEDIDGKAFVPCEMDEMSGLEYFYKTFILLRKGDKYGVLTMGGYYAEPVFDEIDFYDDTLLLRKGDIWGYMDECAEFIETSDSEKISKARLLYFDYQANICAMEGDEDF